MHHLLGLPDELILNIMAFVGKGFLVEPEKLTISKEWYRFACEAVYNGQTLIDGEIDRFARLPENSIVKNLAINKLKRLQLRSTQGTGKPLDLAPIIQLASTAKNLSALRFEVTLNRTWYRIPTGPITIDDKKKALLSAVEAIIHEVEKMQSPTEADEDEISWLLDESKNLMTDIKESSTPFRPRGLAGRLADIDWVYHGTVRDVIWKPQIVQMLKPTITAHLTDLNLDTTGFLGNPISTQGLPPDVVHLCPAIAGRLTTLKRLELRLAYICPDVLSIDNVKEPLVLEKLVIHLLCFTYGSRRLLGTPGETFTRPRTICKVAHCDYLNPTPPGYDMEKTVLEHLKQGKMPKAKEIKMFQYNPIGHRVRCIDFLKKQQIVVKGEQYAFDLKVREINEHGIPTRPPIDQMVLPRNIVPR
ncbi:hypothetical protein K490DRAFT_53054 [Saccharata proteae CBS 121410]|uniref:Uncharacterized protein n=1 Tax=Saccharata proteae CBS 121410 TaxID=1314787 RepID=A0A9P4HZ05_9PEZI|nr:hypothetical protein K490DRAFT_53054 [Saccharata proteae CBS 121410]